MSSGEGSPHFQLTRPYPPGGHAQGPISMASLERAKKKAANYLEKHLAPDTKTAGGHADLSTSGVTGTSQGQGIPFSPSASASSGVFQNGPFRDWAMSTGLSKAHTVWQQQVNHLLNRLASERDALSQAENLIHGNDKGTGQKLQPLIPDAPPYSRLNDL